MGKRDERTMVTPKVLEALAKFVRLEQELVALLQRPAEQDQKMLVEMRGPGG